MSSITENKLLVVVLIRKWKVVIVISNVQGVRGKWYCCTTFIMVWLVFNYCPVHDLCDICCYKAAGGALAR